MLKCEVTVLNRLGLHARAAAKLVRTAESFESRILIADPNGSTHADAKSILSVLSLAAPMGKRLVVTADGTDEKAAIESISQLFNGGFDEL